jgi:hypothetical protein
MVIKYFLFWLPMIVIAFGNATLRQLVLTRYFTETVSHQLSTITLIIFCAIYTGLVYPFLKIQHAGQALLIGFIWMILTILFEFSLGRFLNRSWDSLLQDYNLAAGRIWTLFLLTLFLLPTIFYLLKK